MLGHLQPPTVFIILPAIVQQDATVQLPEVNKRLLLKEKATLLKKHACEKQALLGRAVILEQTYSKRKAELNEKLHNSLANCRTNIAYISFLKTAIRNGTFLVNDHELNLQTGNCGESGQPTDSSVAQVKSYKCKKCNVKLTSSTNCPDCDHATVLYNKLKHHLKNQETYKCEQCYFTSSSMDKFTCHQLVHPKTHKCVYCEKIFHTLNQLNIHLRFHTGERPYKCQQCDAKLISSTLLKRHVREVHSGVKPHKCEHCELSFARENNLKRHVNNIHLCQRPFRCLECDFASDRLERLEVHIEKMHYRKPLHKCEKCDEAFFTASKLKDHVAVAHPYKCTECDYSTTLVNELKQHVKKHICILIKCNKCDFVGSSQAELKSHSILHEEFKTYKCDQCDFVTGNCKKLKVHAKLHTIKKRYKCGYCVLDFPLLDALNSHLLKHRTYQCSYCEYSGKWVKQLKYHMKIHKQPRQKEKIKCEKCDFVCSYKADLKRHSKNHKAVVKFRGCPKCKFVNCKCYMERCSKCECYKCKCHIAKTEPSEKQYKCTHCWRAFASERRLELHIIMHNSDKTSPIKCKYCDFTSLRSDHVYSHELIHTGEKPYKCSECDETFNSTSLVKIHVRRKHTGEKPYKCTQCDLAFYIASALKNHMRTHTGERPHKCKYCKFATAQSHGLKQHTKTQHPDEYDEFLRSRPRYNHVGRIELPNYTKVNTVSVQSSSETNSTNELPPQSEDVDPEAPS